MLQIQWTRAARGRWPSMTMPLSCAGSLSRPWGTGFSQVSRYGDYLMEVAKTGVPGRRHPEAHPAFLKARGLSNAAIESSRREPEADARGGGALPFLHSRLSHLRDQHQLPPICRGRGRRLGFDPEHIFCTELDLDRYPLGPGEAEELRRLQEEILGPRRSNCPREPPRSRICPPRSRRPSAGWTTSSGNAARMDIGAIYQEVSVGGPEKAKTVADSLAKTGLRLADTIYVGDSITDVQAFQAVRAGGGLAISFNGNRYALNAAEVVVVSDSAWSIALLTAIFRLWGKEGVLEVASPESRGKSRGLVLPEEMIEPIATGTRGPPASISI